MTGLDAQLSQEHQTHPSALPLIDDLDRAAHLLLAVRDEVLARLERQYPGFTAQVELPDVATPYTTWRYTLNREADDISAADILLALDETEGEAAERGLELALWRRVERALSRAYQERQADADEVQ